MTAGSGQKTSSPDAGHCLHGPDSGMSSGLSSFRAPRRALLSEPGGQACQDALPCRLLDPNPAAREKMPTDCAPSSWRSLCRSAIAPWVSESCGGSGASGSAYVFNGIMFLLIQFSSAIKTSKRIGEVLCPQIVTELPTEARPLSALSVFKNLSKLPF